MENAPRAHRATTAGAPATHDDYTLAVLSGTRHAVCVRTDTREGVDFALGACCPVGLELLASALAPVTHRLWTMVWTVFRQSDWLLANQCERDWGCRWPTT